MLHVQGRWIVRVARDPRVAFVPCLASYGSGGTAASRERPRHREDPVQVPRGS